MPKTTFEGETHEEMIEAIINAGISYYNSRHAAMQHAQKQKVEKKPDIVLPDQKKGATPKDSA